MRTMSTPSPALRSATLNRSSIAPMSLLGDHVLSPAPQVASHVIINFAPTSPPVAQGPTNTFEDSIVKNETTNNESVNTTNKNGTMFKIVDLSLKTCAMPCDKKSLRWVLLVMVGVIALANHYARDVLATMERQIETEMHLTAHEYDTLNSVFFAPNIFIPPFAGIMCQKTSPALTMLLFCTIAAFGHLVFALAISQPDPATCYSWMLVGRGLVGLSYEALDMLPIPLLQPFFVNEWAFVMGATISFENLGSVLAFLLSPHLYESQGLLTALVISAFVGVFCLPAGLAMWRLDVCLRSAPAVHPPVAKEGKDRSGSRGESDMSDDGERDGDLSASENEPDTLSVKSPKIAGDPFHIQIIDERSLADTGATSVVHPAPAIVRSMSWPSLVESRVHVSSRSFFNLTAMEQATQLRHSHSQPSLALCDKNSEQTGEKRHFGYLHESGVLSMMRSSSFWFFTLGGSLTYSAILPFLLIGGKFLQLRFGYSVTAADQLMVLPSVFLLVLSPVVGAATDALRVSFKVQLRTLCVSLILCPLAMIALALTWPPGSTLLSIVMISSAWTAFNTLFWSISVFVFPERLLGLAVGITGCVINLFVTTVLLLLEHFTIDVALLAFASFGVLSCVCLGVLKPNRHYVRM